MVTTPRSASATFIIDLNLSPSTMNALLNAGFVTVEDVLIPLQRDEDALLHLPGFDLRALSELKARLEEWGFLDSPDAATPLEALGNVLSREMRELEALQKEMASAIAVEVGPPPPSPAPAATFRAPVHEAVPPPEPPRKAAMVDFSPLLRWVDSLRAIPARYVLLGGLILVGGVLLIASIALLGRRLATAGYQSLDAGTRSVSFKNGVVVGIAPESVAPDVERMSVHVESLGSVELAEGSTGRAWKEAIQSLPTYLILQGDLYRFKARGEADQAVTIDIPLPAGAGTPETLDLYTWTGTAWEWLPGEVQGDYLRAHLAALPDNLIVAQINELSPVISADWKPGDASPDALAHVLGEVNPTGMLLGADGTLFGDPNALPGATAGASYVVIPAVRNWAPGATVNRGLLLDVLTIPAIQQTHIANLIQLCAGRGFAGVEIDYRGVTAAEREAYSAFVAALADALHAHDLQLHVVVEPATRADGGWETGGYDWAHIGAAADVVEVPFPADPAAYASGGEAQQMIEWAIRQVNRHKLRMQVSSLSAEQGSAGVRFITLEEALAPFGNAAVLDGNLQVTQGAQVAFGLAGRLLSVTPLDAAGTYRLEYQADGETRVVWPGVATSLFAKLEWARRYQLGGVSVQGLLAPGNAPDVAAAVVAYRTRAAAPPPLLFQVEWTVSSPSAVVDRGASPLTAPGYTWTVLAASGEYTVRATIAGFAHGSIPITVLPPQPVVTQPVTPTETPPAVTADCLAAAYVADVTFPDYTAVTAGQEFIKTWRVRNSGTCAWPAETVLVRIESQLGGPASVPVGAVGVGETVDVSIPLTAPSITGTVSGLWGLQVGQSAISGGRLTAIVQVE